MGAPVIEIPEVVVPDPVQIPTPLLEIPTPDVPSYRPLQLYGTPVPPGTPSPPTVEAPSTPTETAPRRQPAPPPIPALVLPQNQQTPAPVSSEAFPGEGFQSREVTSVKLPLINVNVPVPRKEVVVTAATTSVISVGAALIGTSVFKRLLTAFKPMFKALAKKIQKMRGKPVQSWARERLQGRYQRIKNGTVSQGEK